LLSEISLIKCDQKIPSPGGRGPGEGDKRFCFGRVS
jgi:hypothetical protein